MGVLNSCRNKQTSELTSDVGDGLIAFLFDQKLVWVRVFLQFSLIDDKDAIGINNWGESVGDNEDCCVVESFTQSILNQAFSLHVNLSIWLVKDKDSCLSDYRSGKA